MSRRPRSVLIAPLVLLGVLLAGCGGDDGAEVATDPGASTSESAGSAGSAGAAGTGATDAPDASGSPSAGAEGPDCATVWVAGETLPRGYEGCEEDGERVEPNGRYCEFGKPLVTHDDRFWAVPGGRIGEADGPLLQDAAYKDVLRKCGG